MDIVERLRLGDFSPFSGEYIKDADKDEAANEIERLREALDQALDDMGADGRSVCGVTKAQMRYALGNNVDPEFDYYPLDRAISVLVSVGQFKSEEQAYEALGEDD